MIKSAVPSPINISFPHSPLFLIHTHFISTTTFDINPNLHHSSSTLSIKQWPAPSKSYFSVLFISTSLYHSPLIAIPPSPRSQSDVVSSRTFSVLTRLSHNATTSLLFSINILTLIQANRPKVHRWQGSP